MGFTWDEIKNQPLSWKKTLDECQPHADQFVREHAGVENEHFLFIGCGTSYYLAQSAARAFQYATGRVSIAIAASEVFLADSSVIPQHVPLVAFAISRSGTTSEVVLALKHLRHRYPEARTIAITCHTEAETAKLAHEAIMLPHAAEQSVVMTQSFTNMLLAIQYLAARLAQNEMLVSELDQLPTILEQIMPECERFGKSLGDNGNVNPHVFLGLGIYYGISQEATLKLKEMTQVPCESYNPMEFRHGPISIVTSDTTVLVLSGEAEASYVGSLLDDIRQHGGKVALISTELVVGHSDEITLQLPSGLTDWSRTILYMPAAHFLAYYKATRLGLNPDRPRNLTQVVVL